MTKQKWKVLVEDCFEKIRLIERCKYETKENFAQFCEFIAEPAFETLGEALKEYGLKARIRKQGPLRLCLDISFPKSKATQFSYALSLPVNSIQLKLELRLFGRRDKSSPFKEWTEVFMPQVDPEKLLAITKEEVIEDIISHYRDFMIEILTSAY